jgi:hypothetical protein
MVTERLETYHEEGGRSEETRLPAETGKKSSAVA